MYTLAVCQFRFWQRRTGLCGNLRLPLDSVRRVVKMTGFVNAVPEFADHPAVLNGCSALFVEVFGERGQHARAAIGVGSLPGQIPIEIEVVVEI